MLVRSKYAFAWDSVIGGHCCKGYWTDDVKERIGNDWRQRWAFSSRAPRCYLGCMSASILKCLLYSRIKWSYITTSAALGGVQGPFAEDA